MAVGVLNNTGLKLRAQVLGYSHFIKLGMIPVWNTLGIASLHSCLHGTVNSLSAQYLIALEI